MSWRDKAACIDLPFETFFAGSYDEARVICAACPVTTQCLDFNLAFPEAAQHGFQGGKTPMERRQMKRQMSTGRKVCKVDDCDLTVNSRGWCRTHYERWRRNRRAVYV